MQLVTKQSVINVVESPISGLYYAEIDGTQVTPPMEHKDLLETIMILTADDVPRLLPVYSYNPQASLASPVRYFGEAINGHDVYVFAFMEDGNYIDIFQYDVRDYFIDIPKLNFFCRTAQDGLFFCIDIDRHYHYGNPRKKA